MPAVADEVDRNREDENVACRGSIAMAVATLHPSNDGSRFEVHSKVHTAVPKFIVKSSHRAEIARWIQTIKLNIDYYNQANQTGGLRAPTAKRTASMASSDRPSVPSSSISALPSTDSFLNPALLRSTTGLSGLSAVPRPPSMTGGDDTMDEGGENLSILEAAENQSITGQGDQEPLGASMPHDAEFDMAVLNIKAQIDLTIQLVDSIVTPPSSSSISPERGGSQLARTESRQHAVKQALRSSLSTLSSLVSHQSAMTQDRERYLIARVQREVEARKLWEDNMLAVAKQQAEVDEQLNQAARDNEKKRRALRQARGVLVGINAGHSLPTSPSGPDQASAVGILDDALKSPPSGAGGLPSSGFAPSQPSISNIQEVQDAIAAAETDPEDEDEDEFFDAIEHNTITNLSMHETIAYPDSHRPGTPHGTTPAAVEKRAQPSFEQPSTQPPAQSPAKTVEQFLARQSLEPYNHVRNRLPIDDDKRPSVSCECLSHAEVIADRKCGVSSSHLSGRISQRSLSRSASTNVPLCCSGWVSISRETED